MVFFCEKQGRQKTHDSSFLDGHDHGKMNDQITGIKSSFFTTGHQKVIHSCHKLISLLELRSKIFQFTLVKSSIT